MSQCTNRDLPALAGRFLKQTLIARGITQEQFAEMAHVSDRTVRRWVSGEIHSLDALSDIANALQVEVRDIFAEDVPAYFLCRTHPVLLIGHRLRYNTSATKNERRNVPQNTSLRNQGGQMNHKIAGYENEKREVKQLRHMLHHAAEYRAKGVRIPRGVALYGEPGIGKTVLARSIADDGIGLVELRAANCCAEDAGNAIRETFEVARQQAPCVLLLDELDKIAGTSQSFFMENNDDVRKILLQEIDSLQENEDVLVVATCNDTDCLGNALLRPGRFDRVIAMMAPDEATRREILEMYFAGLKLKTRLDLDRLARMTGGFTGAELECLVNEAGLYVLEAKRKVVTEADVRAVIDRQILQGRERMPSLDAEELRKVAVHEAGHAVVSIALMPEGVLGATVLSQGSSAGHVQVFTAGACPSVWQIEDEVTVLLAGRMAEQLADSEIYLGSELDLKFAAHKILMLATDHAAYGYRYLFGALPEMQRYGDSEAGKDALGQVIETRLNALAARAETILRAHAEAHARITQALVDRKSLTREELFELFREEERKAA